MPYTIKMVYKLTINHCQPHLHLTNNNCSTENLKILSAYNLVQPSLTNLIEVNQSALTILPTNHISLSTTNHNTDQSSTTLAWISNCHLTLKTTSAQDVETWVTMNNSPSQNSFHPDAKNSIEATGFKPFSFETLSYSNPIIKTKFCKCIS